MAVCVKLSLKPFCKFFVFSFSGKMVFDVIFNCLLFFFMAFFFVGKNFDVVTFYEIIKHFFFFRGKSCNLLVGKSNHNKIV